MPAHCLRRGRGDGDRQDPRKGPGRCHPLVGSVHGLGDGDDLVGRRPHLVGVRARAHLIGTFKLSPDPLFAEKVRDIVGLYPNPPGAALVLCVDEKTRLQALDRTAPILPLPPGPPGLPGRRTHDSVRHPRSHLRFTPTCSSWTNPVERWFAELTTTWLRRGIHRSTVELEASITEWIGTWSESPRPSVWKTSADEIRETLAGSCGVVSDSRQERRVTTPGRVPGGPPPAAGRSGSGPPRGRSTATRAR